MSLYKFDIYTMILKQSFDWDTQLLFSFTNHAQYLFLVCVLQNVKQLQALTLFLQLGQ